ncbi:MAG: hypothetical protein K6G84_02500 [Lachnospiraceae bacterium]|nr:hypothetical protein [Lachnospiraceae bacterium]
MNIREFAYKRNLYTLNYEQRVFVAKRIVQDVERIAKERNISEEAAYNLYIKGVFI